MRVRNGNDIAEARRRLGRMWGLGRPLSYGELAQALRLKGADNARDYERGKATISGPLSLALELLLSGAPHPDAITFNKPLETPLEGEGGRARREA